MGGWRRLGSNSDNWFLGLKTWVELDLRVRSFGARGYKNPNPNTNPTLSLTLTGTRIWGCGVLG